MEILKYNEHDYLKWKQNEKICFIDPFCLKNNSEILIRDIIEVDNNCLKIYCDYGHDDIKRRNFNVNDQNNIDKIIILNKLGCEEFHTNFENKYIQLNVYYFKLNVNDKIENFLDYIENEYIIDYIKNIYGNNKITINSLKDIKHKILPECFNEYCVNKCIKNSEKYYQGDLQIKQNNKNNLFMYIWMLICALISLSPYIIDLIKKLWNLINNLI